MEPGKAAAEEAEEAPPNSPGGLILTLINKMRRLSKGYPFIQGELGRWVAVSSPRCLASLCVIVRGWEDVEVGGWLEVRRTVM